MSLPLGIVYKNVPDSRITQIFRSVQPVRLGCFRLRVGGITLDVLCEASFQGIRDQVLSGVWTSFSILRDQWETLPGTVESLVLGMLGRSYRDTEIEVTGRC